MTARWDERNKDISCYINGEIVPRANAAVNLWDAGFLHGKQIWSAPRLVNGKVFRLKDHLNKMQHGIKALGAPIQPTDIDFIMAIKRALIANDMQGATGVHIRVVWTPGTQVTASMNMKAVCGWEGEPVDPTMIVMPEWRGQGTVYDAVKGERAIVSTLRRPTGVFADQTIHSNNQIHSSLACDEAMAAGVAAAIMLDAEGFLAETHASHIAIVKEGKFYTPFVRCCPPGVTRLVLLECCKENGIDGTEDNISVERLFDADEVMIMGTMSGPIAITEIDGKSIANGEIGPVTTKLKLLYNEAMTKEENLFDIFNFNEDNEE